MAGGGWGGSIQTTAPAGAWNWCDLVLNLQSQPLQARGCHCAVTCRKILFHYKWRLFPLGSLHLFFPSDLSFGERECDTHAPFRTEHSRVSSSLMMTSSESFGAVHGIIKILPFKDTALKVFFYVLNMCENNLCTLNANSLLLCFSLYVRTYMSTVMFYIDNPKFSV